MKYESNTPMFSKDITRKPFFVHTGQDVCMYVHTDKGDAICPLPIINGGGIKTSSNQSCGRDRECKMVHF